MKKVDIKKVALVGGFAEMYFLAVNSGCEVIGYFDDSETLAHLKVQYLGDDDEAGKRISDYANVPVVISPDSPEKRAKLSQMYMAMGYKITGLIHNHATVLSPKLVDGTALIHDKVYVSCDAEISAGVRINVGAVIMHDSKIGEYSTIAPNSTVLGRVTIGNSVYVGASSTILPALKIGDYATIGAGAVVTKNVPDRAKVAGVPARPL